MHVLFAYLQPNVNPFLMGIDFMYSYTDAIMYKIELIHLLEHSFLWDENLSNINKLEVVAGCTIYSRVYVCIFHHVMTMLQSILRPRRLMN